MAVPTASSPPKASSRADNFYVIRETSLPARYGRDVIVVMPRDPWWLFCYWELTPERIASARKKYAHEEPLDLVVRVYEEESGESFDIVVLRDDGEWTFKGIPDRPWHVEIGLRTTHQNFIMLARSNQTRTPPEGPSFFQESSSSSLFLAGSSSSVRGQDAP